MILNALKKSLLSEPTCLIPKQQSFKGFKCPNLDTLRILLNAGITTLDPYSLYSFDKGILKISVAFLSFQNNVSI